MNLCKNNAESHGVLAELSESEYKCSRLLLNENLSYSDEYSRVVGELQQELLNYLSKTIAKVDVVPSELTLEYSDKAHCVIIDYFCALSTCFYGSFW